MEVDCVTGVTLEPAMRRPPRQRAPLCRCPTHRRVKVRPRKGMRRGREARGGSGAHGRGVGSSLDQTLRAPRIGGKYGTAAARQRAVFRRGSQTQSDIHQKKGIRRIGGRGKRGTAGGSGGGGGERARSVTAAGAVICPHGTLEHILRMVTRRQSLLLCQLFVAPAVDVALHGSDMVQMCSGRHDVRQSK